MGAEAKADFSGYATKAGLKCSDGRTIMQEAFQHQDGVTVPLVWQHGHNSPENVLGHAILESRKDGVYAYGYFNDTPTAQSAKALVAHKDITALSIFANQLVERSKQVFHGVIREVSLVLSGANPGALIDNVAVQHSGGGVDVLDDEAVIYTGLTLEHEDRTYTRKTDTQTVEMVNGVVVNTSSSSSENTNVVKDTGSSSPALAYSGLEHAKADPTVQDVYDSLSEEQKNVVHYMIGTALESVSAKHSSTDDNTDGATLDNKEGSNSMTHNVFEKPNGSDGTQPHTLSHEDVKGIVADAIKVGSLKQAVESYALQHGITDIDLLFPDAKAVSEVPEWNKRRTEWVAGVINGTKHSPFSRIKTLSADLTFDEARAKGYIKGNLKKEEFFGLQKRVTTPSTIYKKQKLDRDDIVDITGFDVVAWLKGEMRLMLEEELARAILIGDGRDVADEDKIKDPVGAAEGAGIRSILHDAELYVTTVNVNLDDASSDYTELVDALTEARRYYKGTGTPTFYTTETVLSKLLLIRDSLRRRVYRNVAEIAAELRVDNIVTVEVMENEVGLLGVMVNLADYTIGADKGGEVSMFDDFDIDYNQYKYLIETRLSGALTKIKSALVVKKTAGTNVLVDPVTAPTFNAATNVVTIPAQTGVVYKNAVTNATLTAGAQAALTAGQVLKVQATPASGYYFRTDAADFWQFSYTA